MIRPRQIVPLLFWLWCSIVVIIIGFPFWFICGMLERKSGIADWFLEAYYNCERRAVELMR